jgi:hypothetical protein
LGSGSGRQNNICAGIGQGNCNRSADASSGSGHDGYFSVQIDLYRHPFQTLWLLTLITFFKLKAPRGITFFWGIAP